MKFKALTLQSQAGRFWDIITDVGVSLPIEFEDTGMQGKTTYWTTCLWDTGASHSMVSMKVAEILELAPIGDARVLGPHGEAISNIYHVSIVLPNLLFVPEVKVTECVTNEDFGVVIGMDIISLGDFAITNLDGISTFSFCVPGMERIDYVQRIANRNI